MPALTDLTVEWVSLVDRPAVRDAVQQSEPNRFLLWKREHPTGGSMTDAEKAALQKAQDDAKAATDALATAKAETETLKAENADLKKAAEPVVKADEDKVDLSKADPATRAYIEKMEAERETERAATKKAQDEATEAHTLAKAERDARVTREFVTKAEGYKALVVKAEDFGPVLMRVSTSVSKEDFEALEQVLKAADEGLAAGDLFKEQGRARERAGDGTALAEVTKRAEELRKSDPKLSLGVAMQQVFKNDTDLQARYQAETR